MAAPKVLTGEWLHALRIALNLNQEAFAKRLGVRQQTYSKWERNIASPRAMAKAAILRVYHEWKEGHAGAELEFLASPVALTPIQDAFLHFIGGLLKRGQLTDERCVALMTQLSNNSAGKTAPSCQ